MSQSETSRKLSRKAIEMRLAEARTTMAVMERNLARPPEPPGTAEVQDAARGRLEVYRKEVERYEVQLAEAKAAG